jgi:sulfide dehydrogenase cytochrome subunit
MLGQWAAAGEYSSALAWNCNGCHGPGGVSRGLMVPSIAGMNPRYFFKVMRDFKQGERFSTVMERISAGYRVRELRVMADYFAEVPWESAPIEADGDAFLAGQAIHDELCAECHEDAGRYQDKEIPRLAGQWPAYLLQQMIDYRDGKVAMPQPDKMKRRVAELSRAELAALSSFYGQVTEATPVTAADSDAGQVRSGAPGESTGAAGH